MDRQNIDRASQPERGDRVSPQRVSALTELGAVQAAAQMQARAFTASEYAVALLARVDEAEPGIGAWAHLDAGHLLAQAAAADRHLAAGLEPGPLHGVPVGVKDIIDTADLPTQNGTVLHAGRQPTRDAAVVERLRASGALLMGKTVTTELATYAPGKTRNPRDPAHTPGGSSSGSAAAVAAGMAPLAIGTQTNGSVIRPASFCGVVGYKPTFGWIARTGALRQSPSLDQIGVMARSVADVALAVQCLAGYDAGDEATRPRPVPPLLEIARTAPPGPVRLGFVRTPMWERVSPDARAAYEQFAASLGSGVVDVELPRAAADVPAWHLTVMEADIAASFDPEYERGRDRLSESLRGQIERGREIRATEYRRALERRIRTAVAFDALFDDVDAFITPAALGTAPQGLASTGDPIMCTLWTFTGQPAITLPLLQGANGMPLGVQLVGRRDDDARLLRTAAWLERTFRR